MAGDSMEHNVHEFRMKLVGFDVFGDELTAHDDFLLAARGLICGQRFDELLSALTLTGYYALLRLFSK